MFSKNTYFLPQVSQSLQVPANFVVGINGGHEVLFHHHPEMISGKYLAASASPLIEASTLFNQDVGEINVEANSVTANTFQKKQTGKKDRLRKIFTAQGPRDRRVRLSIGIARKFFDLQEMLDFDKPSNTLDWLLTKAKADIKELVQMKQNGGKSGASSPSECEVVTCFGNASSDSKRKFFRGKEAASDLAKESRANARARARERTREKMCIKQLNVARNTTFDQIPYRVNNSTGNATLHYPSTNETTAQDLIHESIVIKTQMKHPAIFGFRQSYTIPSANNATDNWDICAILDQYKFINRLMVFNWCLRNVVSSATFVLEQPENFM
ncbi:hypothetical protein BUALT_Bualt04G0126500 [Buddleja alternifolia]|uniref:Uncharacterized protein n=1 Tax=Buddleja alternifolia TaxID=168488 RepID=A0AAV6XNE2_9LAMI|nr:hypothetical protein BUALT_Bualt04G0126500 [Buddleja alternifolia]